MGSSSSSRRRGGGDGGGRDGRRRRRRSSSSNCIVSGCSISITIQNSNRNCCGNGRDVLNPVIVMRVPVATMFQSLHVMYKCCKGHCEPWYYFDLSECCFGLVFQQKDDGEPGEVLEDIGHGKRTKRPGV